MAPKVIIFAGAPAPGTVHEASCTVTKFEHGVERFMGLNASSSDEHHAGNQTLQSTKVAPWRSLPLHQRPLHSGFSPVHRIANTSIPFNNADHFFTTADVSALGPGDRSSFEETEDILSQFCEQSLAAHNPLPSSQLEGRTGEPSFTSLEETSFMTTSSVDRSDTKRPPLAMPSHLSDLEDIPPARHITAAIPSTITVNLIVGIISIAQPRTITTRWGHQLSLVEVLVGDETKSGFAITFWLSSDNISENQLSQLERQDVVLMRNVALHVFRNKVYGQSLRKGLTQLNLLWRRDGSGYYSSRALRKTIQEHPQVEKTRKTKEWVLHFVGADKPSVAGKKRPRKSWDQPPEDTQ